MTKSRMNLVLSCCAGLVLCFTLVACDDPGSSITAPTVSSAKVKPPRPRPSEMNIYSMAITLEDRTGDAVLSDGAGTYVDGEGAIVYLADLEPQQDQIAVKSGPGIDSRDGQIRIAPAGLDEQCENFQVRVNSSNEFLDLPVGNSMLGTGTVLCRLRGGGKKDFYQIEIEECIAVSRIAEDAWHVVSNAGCVGRLDHFKETIGYYEVPFAFEAVLK
ncbi:MAG: hypothetical protein GTO46_14120 [Gemmatimonadetes bacterium]|nr:hypothetical protein [Gemmatimonadota bacterium]NIO32726.1 hypothetical protein [Gemmatimonadota bacterium]